MSLDSVFEQVEARKKAFVSDRNEPPLIRIWDGNWTQFAEVSLYFEAEFSFENLDSGSASLKIPVDHYIAEALMDPSQWPTKSMYITFDKDGARWSGRIVNAKTEVSYTGDRHLELTAIHDYEKLKELLVWPNPFLPAEVQFPKAWMLFGPSRWVVATTLFVNLLRKNNSLWMVPDDPLNLRQWFNLSMDNWNMAVKPVDFATDNSLTAVVTSRFKSFHDCVQDVCVDAQLSIECRRYLSGDPQPIEGKTLRHGCLVFEVVDKSGWNKPTSFFGTMTQGLSRAIKRVQSDGLTEGLDYVDRVEHPAEYKQKTVGRFTGSKPEAPWVVLEHGEYTGVESTEFEYSPPGPSQFVTGGSSMPGVNEAIKASIIGIGGFLGSLIPGAGQSQLGSVAEAILEPLYSDVFLAFQAHKHHDRIREQGWDFPFEHWVDGGDKAYTLSSLIAMRRAKYDTRERYGVSIKMQDGAPYLVGDNGRGDFFLGDRVAVHALGMPKDKLFVEQVQGLRFSSSYDDNQWEITIGSPEFDSGLAYVAKKLNETRAGLKELGVW